MSRIVRFHQVGGPEVLRLEEVEVPEPGPGELRIRTRALGLNRSEAMFRRGQYLVDPILPSGIGYEASGEVDAVGPGVENVAVGDAVSVVPAFAMTDYAVHGELVLAPARAVVKHPDTLSWEQAASVWMMFMTAYGGLIELADLHADDTVLIPASSSSVGLAAIQIARMVGAHPVALTRTSAKRQQLLDAGAEAVIATTEEDTAARVRDFTGGTGARIIFDPVGGPTVADLAAAAAPYTVIVLYGALSPEPTPLPVIDVLAKHLTIRGYLLSETTQDEQRCRAAIDFVRAGLAKGALTPVIDATFAFDDIADAHHHLEAGSQVGKIVVTIPR
ncbi:zinc-dependent alcohol dehydrogenase family protein [Streptomyces lunaelactis]|uniref:zinc-dependent alcohol dehydrogenase family protein n=1 Tax=Streptomyces lunaelactis TaxID=1535768 RepID=UPI0015849E62|nr:zinc-dependent alcohol dehydrogenase family protein [Streptomyces lunaelactis]NUK01378.1 zinc-dependent alcohol dehydrogenase family protein [Streptomyces lunaelactis]NUK15311.1 zinc-dependent alcohol dehydrogenase family protein [Streptomyces lunaelactis]NUK49957.1 zinc-dependent alcohol dehydrogenase family protein [Streptomyces lunaelactis]NUK64217.1 zinc-dependent alcohol dehydrogenase family protein [Streptomyces lunaelactis]NUK69627.1 zinc-dependent alcohol dehydrogenase family protei